METCDMIWNKTKKIEYSKAFTKHYNDSYFWGDFL
jgi:hypothetical protein